jgi:hypothetical protein
LNWLTGRYHEEQIWSDKIRRASTWGTFALMGVNVVLFIVVQVGLEPWRRKRLVRGFEEKVKEVVLQGQSDRLLLQDEGTVRGNEADSLRRGGKDAGELLKGFEKGDTITGMARHNTNENNTEKTGGETSTSDDEWIIVDSEEILPVDKDTEGGISLHEKKDVWIGAAGGVVIGSFVTALGTYLLSR